jgi:hypothetical protein
MTMPGTPDRRRLSVHDPHCLAETRKLPVVERADAGSRSFALIVDETDRRPRSAGVQGS